MTNEEFVARLKVENPHDLSLLDTYIGKGEKIRVQCNKCNYIWNVNPSNLLYKKTGCPKCLCKVITNDEYINKLKSVNDSIIPIEPYINSSTNIAVKCDICKHIWKPRPADLFRGRGCPNCANMKKAKARRKTDDEFKKELASKNPDVDVLGEYVDDKTKVQAKCRNCGHGWSVTPSNLLRGRSCPKCAINNRATKRRKSNEDFLVQIETINPLIDIKERYSGDAVPLLVKCKQCNHLWKVRPSNLLQGNGCPRCARSQSSFMEQYIYWAFVYALGEDKVLYRNRMLIDNELDIYIPDKKLAIEPGGYYYHKDSLDVDYAKIEKCKEIGIRLVIIYDNCREEVQDIDKEDVYFYKYDLKYETNNQTLRAIISRLFEEYDIIHEMTEDFWNQVYDKATIYSRRKNKEQLQVQLENNGFTKIVVKGEYEGTHKLISVKCVSCGYEWDATPHNLLAGKGCPKCAVIRVAALRCKRVRCVETGEIFGSISEANKKFHTKHVGDVCNNKREIAGGYHWEFYQE